MFNPNLYPHYHHRSADFHRLYQDLEETFRSTFNVGPEWEVYFISGSGTVAIEACIYSACQSINPLDFLKGKFSDRLKGLIQTHNKFSSEALNVAYVQYETSTSQFNFIGWKPQGHTIVDCVSAFPYYDVPREADVWVTVSGKQLGAYPGLGIVVCKRKLWDFGFYAQDNGRVSYLDLAVYRNAACDMETPFTPCVGVMESLNRSLKERHFRVVRNQIDAQWEILCHEFGAPPDQSPPVYTFKGLVPKLHEELGLYGKDRTQIFLWGSDKEHFSWLVRKLREAKSGGGPSFWWD